MAENQATVQAHPAGQPEQTSGQPESAGTQQPTYLTRDEALSLTRSAIAEYDKSMSQRVKQSLSDRDKSIRAEMQAMKDTLSARGAQVPDENLLRAIAEQRVDAPVSAPVSEPAPQPTAGQPKGGTAASEHEPTDSTTVYVNSSVARLQRKLGVTLEKEDPEAQGLRELTDPEDFLDKFEEALKAKKQRISTAPQARIPSLGGNGPTSNASLEQSYKNEMLANRGKGIAVGNQIKDKFRKQGLDVDNISLYR